MLPTSVDLRSELDSVYSQAQDKSCGPHAVANMLDCVYDRCGKPRRHARGYTWWWSQFWFGGFNAVAQGMGSTFESLERALRVNGTMTDAEWAQVTSNQPPNKGSVHGLQLVRTYSSDIKRLLAMGVPVMYLMVIYPGFYNLRGDWKTHRWDLTGERLGEHFVSIVGYDDEAQRYLVENSWDATWGDGGFFGLPYDMAIDPMLMQGISHIDRIPGMHPKPADNYSPEAPMTLNPTESAEFVTRSKDALRDTLMSALASGGIPALVAAAHTWGVSDKHLEVLAGWPRGTVRGFAAENPAIGWDKQIWDRL